MRILSKKILREFWTRHARAEAPLQAWFDAVSDANWQAPEDVRRRFGNSVDFVRDNRVIFDIGGNKYRLIAHIGYRHSIVYIKFVGTHAEYDQIDPGTIG